MARVVIAAALGLVLGGMTPAAAADAPADARTTSAPPAPVAPEAFPTDGDAYHVERVKPNSPKNPTLRFLGENRAFFRARLDDLRTRLRADWDGTAGELDPRWLAWRDMLDAIQAARDTAAVSEEWIRRRELMNSVGELVELELEMDEMAGLLEDQQARLTELEEDFVGRQQTALVVLLKGVPAAGAPRTVILREPQGDAHRIAVTERVAASLERGGSAELFHRLVEPRDHLWEISFEGADLPPFEVALDPERNRMTFLEIDVSDWDAVGPPPTRRWVR